MKTNEQKLQHVMEAAGECWHNFDAFGGCLVSPSNPPIAWCSKCNAMARRNPSPDDLNELTHLLIKLNFAAEVDIDNIGRSQVSIHADGNLSQNPAGQSVDGLQYDVALLNALYSATGGKDE